VGVLAMDGEKHKQIAKRAYALWQAEYFAAREIAAADSTSGAVKRPTRREKRKT
jgi:hypothetical protein